MGKKRSPTEHIGFLKRELEKVTGKARDLELELECCRLSTMNSENSELISKLETDVRYLQTLVDRATGTPNPTHNTGPSSYELSNQLSAIVQSVDRNTDILISQKASFDLWMDKICSSLSATHESQPAANEADWKRFLDLLSNSTEEVKAIHELARSVFETGATAGGGRSFAFDKVTDFIGSYYANLYATLTSGLVQNDQSAAVPTTATEAVQVPTPTHSSDVSGATLPFVSKSTIAGISIPGAVAVTGVGALAIILVCVLWKKSGTGDHGGQSTGLPGGTGTRDTASSGDGGASGGNRDGSVASVSRDGVDLANTLGEGVDGASSTSHGGGVGAANPLEGSDDGGSNVLSDHGAGLGDTWEEGGGSGGLGGLRGDELV